MWSGKHIFITGRMLSGTQDLSQLLPHHINSILGQLNVCVWCFTLRPFDSHPRQISIPTGGSEGIGYALAELFIDHSAKVTLASRSKEKLEDAQRQLQSRSPHAQVLTCPTDVGSHQQVRHL